MIIAIASGKGGTGKTTIATSLAVSLDAVQLLDCDVEEPNAHLFINPLIHTTEAVCIPVPQIDEKVCIQCGICKQVCRYNAIAVFGSSVLVFPELCHGCGACMYACHQHAIKEIDKEVGVVEIGKKEELDFVSGKLNIAEVMAPPVIRAVKKKINKNKTVIIDAPPGTSCPVIGAMKDSDFCILVTEPTPFGLHDLTLAVDVVREMSLPYGVVINRADLGTNETESFCNKEHIPVLMRIPFKREIAVAYSKGIPIVTALPELKEEFQKMFEKIRALSAEKK